MTRKQINNRKMFDAARKSDVKFWEKKVEQATYALGLAQEHINRGGANLAIAEQVMSLEEDRAYYRERLNRAKRGQLLPFRKDEGVLAKAA